MSVHQEWLLPVDAPASRNADATTVTTSRTTLIPCGICGSDVFRKRYATTDFRAATPGSWDVATCARCGVTLLNPPPGNEALAAAYPDWLWQNDIPRRNAKPYRVNRTLDVLARHVSPPGMLFDVGCGPGSLLAEATRRGWIALLRLE